MNAIVPIIIPAYEPDERLLILLKELKKAELNHIILVNDGSSKKYDDVFLEASKLIEPNGNFIVYPENQGKGYALKTAFEYVLEHLPDAVGVVTADSDGQHTVECIQKMICALKENPDNLILGVRQFDGDNVPWKSKFGNNLTIKIFQLVTGAYISDTQTGLRGIPKTLMKECLLIKENRFEFEMKMLIQSVDCYRVTEVPIQTVYDSKIKHQTHFNPLKDSFRIYRILLWRGIKYTLSSLLSFIIDISLFTIVCAIFKNKIGGYVAVATILSRVISSLFNYLINFKFVFKSKGNIERTATKYFILVIIQMLMSAFLVTLGTKIMVFVPEILIKMVIDTCLFVISYFVQKKIVF